MNNVPYGSFGFKVEVSIDDKIACFQEVSGLSANIKVDDYAEGGVNWTTRKLISGASYSNIILKRGLCSNSMFSWINGFLTGNDIKRIDGNIKLLDDNGKVVKTFHFERGVPVKWEGPTLNVMNDSIATETLEIAHEGLKVI